MPFTGFWRFLESIPAAIVSSKIRVVRGILRRFAPDWLLPNHLTIMRMGLALPATTFILFRAQLAGLIFFVVAAALDLLDGELARMRGLETDQGEFLDIFADKVLGGLALIAIYTSQRRDSELISASLFWLTLGLDLVLVFLWLGGKTMPIQVGWKRRLGANIWGKWKFSFQCLGISFLLIGFPMLGQSLLSLAIPLAVVSVIGHLAFGTRDLQP